MNLVHHQWVIPPLVDQMEVLCLEIRSILRDAVPSREDRFALEVLYREALANALDHGCADLDNCCITVTMEQQSRLHRGTVKDTGSGYSPLQVESTGLTPESNQSERGRGLFLIRQLSHRCIWEDNGRQCCFERDLKEAD